MTRGGNNSVSAVYPRPRGGTSKPPKTFLGSWGLSPPTRGNRLPRRAARSQSGSIPAHAGEPARSRPSPESREVYPRPRGGTMERLARRARRRGLSPPTRGNPGLRERRGLVDGSIPAHAGEPDRAEATPPTPRVYPRPRGGTAGVLADVPRVRGLSPPTRGNRCPKRIVNSGTGSIPAHAGEPAGEPILTRAL